MPAHGGVCYSLTRSPCVQVHCTGRTASCCADVSLMAAVRSMGQHAAAHNKYHQPTARTLIVADMPGLSLRGSGYSTLKALPDGSSL